MPVAVAARAPRWPAVLGVLAVAVVVAIGLRLTVLAPAEDESATPVPTGAAPDPAATGDPDCPAAGHADLRITGLQPGQVRLLPADYSFFGVADDGCTPVRWNPCEPVHYVVNAAQAPPTGVADVREAFARMGEATGITFVDDGITDEEGGRRRARYQPERYGERWAPILVHWRRGAQRDGNTQVVGGGIPGRVGGVYVTGVLFLNADAVTDFATGTPVEGGFGPDPRGAGPIGPSGVTWGRVILHEVGHLMGLGHVRDPRQLMYPETAEHITRPTQFSDGDLAGLRHLGAAAGCLTAPPPAARGR